MDRVTVVGATGLLGREAARQLIAAGWAVTAVTRHPHRAADLVRLGAEVRKADLLDPTSLPAACRGSDAVFVAAHSMLGRGRSRSEEVDGVGHRALIDAARVEGVRHFVYTKITRIPAGVLTLLSTLTRPLHPGVSRVLRAGAVSGQLDQRFDPGELLKMYPLGLTRMEDFVRERVAQWNGSRNRARR